MVASVFRTRIEPPSRWREFTSTRYAQKPPKNRQGSWL
jgi:hypothetical protein